MFLIYLTYEKLNISKIFFLDMVKTRCSICGEKKIH